MSTFQNPSTPDWFAGEKEEVLRQDQVTRLLPNDSKVYGSLWITNYRLVFKSSDPEVDPTVRDVEVAIGSIKTIRKIKPSETSGTKAQSLIKIESLDFQVVQLCFPLNSGGNARTLGAVEKVLAGIASLSVSFATVSGENWEPFNVVCEASWVSGMPNAEFERKGFLGMNEFRMSDLNAKYKLSPSYPPTVPVPNSAADLQIEDCASAREGGQFPIVTWRSVTGGMLLMRALSQTNAQPPDEDLVFVRLMMLKCPGKLLRIFDVGSKRAYTYPRQYAQFIPEHLDLPSQAQVNSIFGSILENLHSTKEIHLIACNNSPWSLILTRYMEQVSALSKLVDSGFSILIQGTKKHFGHVALSTVFQVVCDPTYRTLAGLCILIEKEWIHFTFPFREHTMTRDKGEIPIFELTIHLLWMLVQAHPTRFEYGERVLAFILDHLFSARFVTFQVNVRRDWDRLRAPSSNPEGLSTTPNATSIWAYIQTHASDFTSPAFDATTIPAEYWPSESSGPLGAVPSPSPTSATGVLTIGQCPHMLAVETLAALPMIWRERFVANDFQVKTDLVKAAALAKPGYGGNSIYSLSPAFKSICRISPRILSLPGLTMLHFKNASLTHLPLEIVAAANLEDFSVAGNPIRHLPETWVQFIGKHLNRLRILDFDKTCIGHVVLSIHKHIPTLHTLKLGSLERLTERALEISATIPPWPLNSRFDCLELPSNGLNAIPPRFVNLVHVSQVDLAGNKFTNIPLQLEYFARLSKLNFSDNMMSFILPPQGGFRMDLLNSLNLAGNGLEVFPDHLGNLPNLRSLSLARNKLSDLSQRFFMQFKLLDILDVSFNKLTTLPMSIGYMSKLTYFDLSGNTINMIPDSVVGMTNLKYLDLSYNKLPSLAVCFGRLKSLHTLKISYNSMTVLPPHLGSLRDTLQTFDFTGNELVTPPLDIIKGGSKAVLDFLYDSLSGSKPIYRMKMMIVGEENVGKTTLVDQLTRRWKAASSDGIYEPISTLSTDGIAISTCSFRWKNEGEKKIPRLADEFDVNISWWDFAGQELYYTTHQFFLSGRSIFVVVWNLEKPIEDSRVDFWLNSIQSKISNATVVLVGTHLDGLKGPARDNIPDLFKQTKLRLRMLFPSLDIVAFAASARTGEGLVELKEALERKIVGSKHMGEVLPSTYLLLERMVMDGRAIHSVPIVSKHKFLEMSLMCNISGDKELFRASNLLHNLGTLIYFDQDLVLSRYVILDPQWLAKLMSTLITTKHSFVTAGVISHRALGQIWREFPLAMYGFLLGLLEKFEVTYNLSGFIDPASLGSPTALQLISLQDRYPNAHDAANKKKAQKKAKASASSPASHAATGPREWLHALIPMLKRHPNVVIGNSPLRKLLQYTSAGLIQPGSRSTLATALTPSAFQSANEPSSRISLPPNSQARRVVSYYGGSETSTISSGLFDPLSSSAGSSSLASSAESPSKKYSPNVQKILERGDVVGSFDLEGVSLIPSLLPAVPPPHFEARNMFPAIPSPGEIEFTRDYVFDFVPDGLTSRLTVRLLQRFLDQTKEFVMWKEGILLIRPDCTIFAHLLQRDTSRVLRLRCRGTDFLEVGRVFSAALEANGILFKEWPRLRISQEVMCPHCVSAGISSPTYFSLETLLDAVRDDLAEMTCSIQFGQAGLERIDEFKLPLERLTPDFRLVYLKGAQLKYSDLVIEKQIGLGGFAVVYKGTLKGQTIAIKQLHVGSGDDADQGDGSGKSGPGAASVLGAVDMDPIKLQAELDAISSDEYTKAFNEFRKEAFMLSDISDENCVRMHGVCLKPFCLVTEFVACGDLYALCHSDTSKEISWPLRLRIALDMAKGMYFLHSLKPPIIHNDLKSPNVLLASLDPYAPVVAKISDFGLSMRMSKMYTRLVDNPVWIAPEIMRGATYDTKADVYAYGVMLWEMLERRGFFEEIVFNSELEKKVMAGERPVIENDTLPEYEKLIRACWDNDPLRRPPFENIIALLEQLIEAYQRGLTVVTTSSEMLLPGAQRGRRAAGALNTVKPAFIREKSNNSTTESVGSTHSSPPSSAANSPPQSIILPEPEIEETVLVAVAPTPPTPGPEGTQSPPPTMKIRLNVGGGARKAPSRADIIAQAKVNPDTGLVSPRTETTSPRSPTASPAEWSSGAVSPRSIAPVAAEVAPAKPLSSMDRLNMLLGPNSQKIAVVPPVPTQSATPTSPTPTSSTSPKRSPTDNSLTAPTASSPSIEPNTRPALISETKIEPVKPVSGRVGPAPGIRTSPEPEQVKTPPAPSDVKPLSATMKFQSRDGGRPVSLNSALKGSITGLLSSLQSLKDVSETMETQPEDDGDSTSHFASASPSSPVVETTAVPASVLANLTPIFTPQQSPAPSTPQPSTQASTVIANLSTLPTASPSSSAGVSSSPQPAATKNLLISEADAKIRMTELSTSLQTILKQVVAMSSALRGSDQSAFQTAVLDTIKYIRVFRDVAGVPAGFKAINSLINEKLLLLRSSLKSLVTQIVTLLQIARLVLKQDPSVTKESFAASATSFVASFKITTGALDLVNLDGVMVMEIEPIDLTA